MEVSQGLLPVDAGPHYGTGDLRGGGQGSQGSGTLTNHRLKYAVDVYRRDMEDLAVIPKATETDAVALIRVLQEQKCRFHLLVYQRT